MEKSPNVLFLQFNELNFPYVEHYCRRGLLPNFKAFFERHGFVLTTSESEHRLANPWIQWPTVHTGLDYADHGVFRLGDIVKCEHPMIYEVLESHGVSVAALGAFNAKNSTRNAAFFVPDPWTPTDVNAPASLGLINEAFRQVTDDYAKDRIAFKSLVNLVLGGAVNIHWPSLPSYLRETLRFLRGEKWMRAVVADRLLGDAFITQCAKHKPQFATVFLNGGAHLQHHYLFSSSAYEGPNRNPEWHVPAGKDPLLDVLKAYDRFLARAVKLAGQLPGGRVLLATALHQEPHERETYYYRLDDQEAFLKAMGIEFQSSYRLMTEDFVAVFETEAAAAAAESMVLDIRTLGIDPLFYVETGDSEVRTKAVDTRIFHTENRGKDLYIQLRPLSQTIPKGKGVQRGNTVLNNFDKLVSLAQYKNTHHHGLGYFSDSAYAAGQLPQSFPLRDIFPYILSIFDVPDPKIATLSRDLIALDLNRAA